MEEGDKRRGEEEKEEEGEEEVEKEGHWKKQTEEEEERIRATMYSCSSSQATSTHRMSIAVRYKHTECHQQSGYKHTQNVNSSQVQAHRMSSAVRLQAHTECQ